MIPGETWRPTPRAGVSPWLTVVLCALLSGCATWADHGVAARAPQPLRIAVLPVRDASEIKDLRDVESVTTTSSEETQTGLVKERMAAVTADITRALEARLSATPHFEVIPAAQVQQALAELSPPPIATAPLSPARAEQLGAALNAQALLHVDLAGYGKLKRSWLTFLIGTGMVEAVVQGLIVTRATSSSAAGLAVGLEEAVQELLTWGGGAYLIQRRFLPVILKGQLISTTDGEVVWSDTAIDTLDRKALETLPAEKRNDRATQLELTTERAINELTADLLKETNQELGGGDRGESSAAGSTRT